MEAGYADVERCRPCEEEPGTLYHRNDAINGCKCMKQLREDSLCPEATTYAKTCYNPILTKHGLMMKRYLPNLPKVAATEENQQWANAEAGERYFTGDTCVDGSNITYHPEHGLERAGYSVVSVVDQCYDSDHDELEQADCPEDDEMQRCACKNRDNPSHERNQYRIDNTGCD